MSKLFCFVLALELCMALNFTRGVVYEDYDESNDILEKNSKKRATDGANNTALNNILVNSSTVDSTNISLTKPLNENTVGNTNKQIVVNSTNINNNNSSKNLNNSQQLETVNDQKKVINNLLNNITSMYPEATRNVNNTLHNLGIKDPTIVLMKLNNSNISLHELQNSINETNIEKEINKTKALADSEISKAVLRHKAETALNDINRAMRNTSLSELTNRTTNILKKKLNNSTGVSNINLTMLLDPNYNPTLWLMRLQAPWKHVSGSNTANQTEVVQVCKFEAKVATCSAQYSSWDTKAWFQFAESPDRNGINITVYERGHTPRVTFYNKVNGTDCQVFNNGSLHQICVKIYGYDKDLGPTRVCLEFGAAIFNHGVASTDFGCFRFGSAVRHEDAMEGEMPHPNILNRYILANNYSNINNDTGNGSLKTQGNIILLIASCVLATLFDRKFIKIIL